MDSISRKRACCLNPWNMLFSLNHHTYHNDISWYHTETLWLDQLPNVCHKYQKRRFPQSTIYLWWLHFSFWFWNSKHLLLKLYNVKRPPPCLLQITMNCCIRMTSVIFRKTFPYFYPTHKHSLTHYRRLSSYEVWTTRRISILNQCFQLVLLTVQHYHSNKLMTNNKVFQFALSDANMRSSDMANRKTL